MDKNEKVHYVDRYICLDEYVSPNSFIEQIKNAVETARKEGAIAEGTIELQDVCTYGESPYNKIFYCYRTPENEDEKKLRLKRKEEADIQMRMHYENLKKHFEKELKND